MRAATSTGRAVTSTAPRAASALWATTWRAWTATAAPPSAATSAGRAAALTAPKVRVEALPVHAPIKACVIGATHDSHLCLCAILQRSAR